MQLTISHQELTTRRENLTQCLRERNVNLFCAFNPSHIFYLTGIYLIQTERPMALVYDNQQTIMFAPLLEKDHLKQLGGVDKILTYDEYPGDKHPLKKLAREIKKRKPSKIGVDSDGYGGGHGYEGPPLSDLVSAEITKVDHVLKKMMMIKSEEEINLIKESVRWGNLAHSFLQDYTHSGITENEVSVKASVEASKAMLKTLGPGYIPPRGSDLPARAGYRGQIGKMSAIPHALTTNATIQEGHVLVTGASADVGGYLSELERTMIVGPPTKKQTKLFQLMVEAQDLAFQAIQPGRKFSHVDKKLTDFYQNRDLTDYWRHHVGHNIGIHGHEAPYFDRGDDREIKPGMVVTVEPGVYVPDYAGFRHSDTVLVTEKGTEVLTYYPRDLDSLTI